MYTLGGMLIVLTVYIVMCINKVINRLNDINVNLIKHTDSIIMLYCLILDDMDESDKNE